MQIGYDSLSIMKIRKINKKYLYEKNNSKFKRKTY